MTKVYRGHNAKILLDGLVIGSAKNVRVSIKENLEIYFGVDSPNVRKIIPGEIEIEGSLSKAWVNIYYLSLMGVCSTPFLWDNSKTFDLIFQESETLGGCLIYLYNCRFYHTKISIPQDGWLEEDYDFISITPLSTKMTYPDLVRFDEPINWGYFDRLSEIYFLDPMESHGGGYFEYYPIFISDPFGMQGGGYFCEPIRCKVEKGVNQVINGDFGTGDFTGFQHPASLTIDPLEGHIAIPCAKYDGSPGGYLKAPTLTWAISIQGCLDSSSVFSVWMKAQDSGTTISNITVTFSDGFETYFSGASIPTDWTEFDILEHINWDPTRNADIWTIQINFQGDGKIIWIDDFNLTP